MTGVARATAPRHLRIGRHRRCGRHECDRAEVLCWVLSGLVRFVRDEDGGPKVAVSFAGLFLAFAVLIGAFQ